jgi:hypothetical protein
VLPGGIGHVYDNEHSYPIPNADIGMIGGAWILDTGWKEDRQASSGKILFNDEGSHDRPKFSGVD